MKKTLKYCSISFGILFLSVILALGILYVVKPGLLRRMLGRVRHTVSYVFVDRLKGRLILRKGMTVLTCRSIMG